MTNIVPIKVNVMDFKDLLARTPNVYANLINIMFTIQYRFVVIFFCTPDNISVSFLLKN